MFKFLVLASTICFAQPLFAQNSLSRVTFTVNMEDQEVDTSGIFIIGNFFNNTPESLINNEDGTWSYNASFSVGDTLFYLFTNGNQQESIAEGTCLMEGDRQRFYIVPEGDTVEVGTVCFESCNTCSDSMITATTDDLLQQWNVKVYPNPMVNKTLVSWNNVDVEVNQIQITDLSGRLLRDYNNIINTELSIEKGALLKGMYLLRITDQAGRIGVKKIMVQ